MSLFLGITIVMVVAVLAGFLAHTLRQPPIIGFILAGLAVGYFASPDFGLVETIEGLAPIGVALLLFLVGLDMNLRELRNVGISSLLTGIGQIIFTFGVGYVITTTLGFSVISAVYISTALTFSSTIIVVKLLSEKKDLKSLYGRIVIGFLLVQDFVAILAIVFLTGLQRDGALLGEIFTTLGLGGAFIAFAFIASHLLPKIIDRISRSQEMLYLFSIGWVLGVAALTEAAGLSIEAGGFIAGVSLARSSEHFQIGARLRPLRDFFLILFFVILGVKMLIGGIAVPVIPAVVLALFVLIGNPLIVMVIMGLLGYRSRTSFLASLTVAQISEFSLIIAALGLRFGHIASSDVGLITLVGIITIFVSSYFIIYGDHIYRALRPVLHVFEFRKKFAEETSVKSDLSNHTVLIGVYRTGRSILEALEDSGEEFIALDFDPMLVKALKKEGVPVVYGDATDEEIQELVGMDKARLIISTMPDFKDNLVLLGFARTNGRRSTVIVTADDERQAIELYNEGADYVIVPHYIGGKEIAELITGNKDFAELKRLKAKDLKSFKA